MQMRLVYENNVALRQVLASRHDERLENAWLLLKRDGNEAAAMTASAATATRTSEERDDPRAKNKTV